LFHQRPLEAPFGLVRRHRRCCRPHGLYQVGYGMGTAELLLTTLSCSAGRTVIVP